MLVVTRHSISEAQSETFLASAREALAALAARPGHVRGYAGRSTEDPTLWVLVTEWESVGAYRRALSAYDVKVRAAPLLSTAYDEPSAFEILTGRGDETGSDLAADAGSVSLGSASAPAVRAWGQGGSPDGSDEPDGHTR